MHLIMWKSNYLHCSNDILVVVTAIRSSVFMPKFDIPILYNDVESHEPLRREDRFCDSN